MHPKPGSLPACVLRCDVENTPVSVACMRTYKKIGHRYSADFGPAAAGCLNTQRGNIYPRTVSLCGGDRGMNGGDALQSIFGRGVTAGEWAWLAPLLVCAQKFRQVGIDIGEGAEESFGMSHRHARGAVCLGRKSGNASFDDRSSAADRGPMQLV